VLILFIVPLVQIGYNSVCPDNAKRFADLPNIIIAKDTDIIPPTDEQHLVQVTPKMAELKARTVLVSNDYSSRYTIGKLKLQAIKGHRYYATPLVPTSSNDTFWTPLFGGRTEGPGYVLVDAEDKEAHPQLRDGFKITLYEDMPWGLNLSRFAYQAGYDKGELANASFEVDDEFRPHWSITYITPAFGDIVGSKISKVLLIDVATAEPKLSVHEQGAPEIKWVDRVVSSDLIREYAKDWGLYGQAYSQSSFGAWLQVFLGLSKQDAMTPADGDEGQLLSYTKSQSLGSTGAAIGFMDARSQEVSDVAYGTDLHSALRAYATKLAHGSNGMQAAAAIEVVTVSSARS
jgi:hypothetical protein